MDGYEVQHMVDDAIRSLRSDLEGRIDEVEREMRRSLNSHDSAIQHQIQAIWATFDNREA